MENRDWKFRVFFVVVVVVFSSKTQLVDKFCLVCDTQEPSTFDKFVHKLRTNLGSSHYASPDPVSAPVWGWNPRPSVFLVLTNDI